MTGAGRIPYSLELALRFLRGGRGSILRTSAAVAFGGLALGVAALVVTMGLMTGYRRDLADALVAVNAEILLYADPPASFSDSAAALRIARGIPGVASAAEVVIAPGFAFPPGSADGATATLKGYDPADGLPSALARRAPVLLSLPPTRPGELPAAWVGEVLANRLGLVPGEPFRMLLPDASGASLRPRSATFRLAGTFATGFSQYDGEWVFAPRDAARRALRLATPTAVEVRLAPDADLDRVRRALERSLPVAVRVVDWRSLNRPLFAALAYQQAALFFALALVVGVAAFNLAASLRALAAGRTRDVGLLVATGAPGGFVQSVFLWCGAILGVAGTAAGLASGWAICVVLTATRAIRFSPEIAEIYFVRWIPFRPEARDLAAIGVTAVALSIAAAVAPARRAARLDPAAALRYE